MLRVAPGLFSRMTRVLWDLGATVGNGCVAGDLGEEGSEEVIKWNILRTLARTLEGRCPLA